MARQSFLDTPDDIEWLRDVHIPNLPANIRSAIVYGNEDAPDRVEVYERAEPVVSDVPIVYEADQRGELRRVERDRRRLRR